MLIDLVDLSAPRGRFDLLAQGWSRATRSMYTAEPRPANRVNAQSERRRMGYCLQIRRSGQAISQGRAERGLFAREPLEKGFAILVPKAGIGERWL